MRINLEIVVTQHIFAHMKKKTKPGKRGRPKSEPTSTLSVRMKTKHKQSLKEKYPKGKLNGLASDAIVSTLLP